MLHVISGIPPCRDIMHELKSRQLKHFLFCLKHMSSCCASVQVGNHLRDPPYGDGPVTTVSFGPPDVCTLPLLSSVPALDLCPHGSNRGGRPTAQGFPSPSPLWCSDQSQLHSSLAQDGQSSVVSAIEDVDSLSSVGFCNLGLLNSDKWLSRFHCGFSWCHTKVTLLQVGGLAQCITLWLSCATMPTHFSGYWHHSSSIIILF